MHVMFPYQSCCIDAIRGHKPTPRVRHIETRSGSGPVTIGRRARRLALALGLFVGLGALTLAAAPATSATPDPHPSSSVIAARDFSTAPSATRPTRSIRFGLLAALLGAAFMAAIAICSVAFGRHRPARRRVEQFFARRRGPPILLVAH
jgi:hypothetical protein